MNREIIFRGKRYENGERGEWVFGYLFIYEVSGAVMILDGWESPVETYVDPSTVGQYTGLTDANGTRIFEGDIVTINDGEEPLVVTFINFSWRLVSKKKEYKHYSHLMDAEDIYTVIGNIHENQGGS